VELPNDNIASRALLNDYSKSEYFIAASTVFAVGKFRVRMKIIVHTRVAVTVSNSELRQ
jgi:hypothetical protein